MTITLPQPFRTIAPTLSSPQVVHVSGRYGSIDGSSSSAVRVVNYPMGNAYAGTAINGGGKDVQLVFDGPVYTNLFVTNCRVLSTVGFEFDIDRPLIKPSGWTSGSMPFNNASDPHGWLNGPRNAFQVTNTGLFYAEGGYIHGAHLIDCFKLSNVDQTIIQGVLGQMVASNSLGSGAAWTQASGGFHNDFLQYYGKCGTIDIDWCTVIVNFQGIMTLISNTPSGTNQWGTTKLSRVNFASAHYRGLNSGDNLRSSKYSGAFNLIPPSFNPGAQDIKGPFLFDDVWIEPDYGLFTDLNAAMGASGGTYNFSSVSDTELGNNIHGVQKKKIAVLNWPVTGGDPSGQLFPGTRFGGAADSRYIREGKPVVTLAHPENPAGADYVTSANVGIGYVSPGSSGVTPPATPGTVLTVASAGRPPYQHYQRVP